MNTDLFLKSDILSLCKIWYKSWTWQMDDPWKQFNFGFFTRLNWVIIQLNPGLFCPVCLMS